jgi:transposase-like protein
VDESKFGKRKDNKGRRAKGMWVLGIISEQERGRIVLVPIADRSASTIIPIIKKYVAPGTVIKTDGLTTYGLLKYEGYYHKDVNHSKHLVDPYTGVHTNLIEGSWMHAKKSFPGHSMPATDSAYAEYLYQFAYRRLVKCKYGKQDPFLVFLKLWGEVNVRKWK